MIVVRLIGGLGNQMFQYAAGRRVATLKKTILKMDAKDFEKDIATKRVYSLGVFNIQEEFATEREIRLLRGGVGSFAERFPKVSAVLGLGKTSTVKESELTDGLEKVRDNSYLEGYWQSEKFFKEIGGVIRKDFTFKNGPDKRNALLFRTIGRTNSVSVHIRRADYLSPKYRGIYSVCSTKYFDRAIGLIKSRVRSPRFYVFSEDQIWARKNLKLGKSAVFVDWNLGRADYEDMRLMSACKHNIMANSSFSWWGAWLNPNPGKIVIAPAKWFKHPNLEKRDMIPSGWRRIDG